MPLFSDNKCDIIIVIKYQEECMTNYYLAIDIGSSSGRHILGYIQEGKIVTEEIYRFENKTKIINGHTCWDINEIRDQVLNGMKVCREIGKIPQSLAIDTWGVDYVLLDDKDMILGQAVSYRDQRTAQIHNEIEKYISDRELYARTGLSKQNINTIGQLMSQKITEPELMSRAKTFLMIPDYLNFFLTGRKSIEYTDASTTQLLHCKSCDWDYELISRLGLPKNIFIPISKTGDELGCLTKYVAEYVGYNTTVVHCASHDTASAVVSVPLPVDKKGIYLSSGTWSIIGIETDKPNCSAKSMKYNFSNEGGYEKRYRYLKNIIGLWFIQSIKKELDNKYSFSDLQHMAESEGECKYYFDVNDRSFLSPNSMIEAIKNRICITNISMPKLLSVVYCSLAESYAVTVRQIKELTGESFDKLIVIGGGSMDEHLNKLTAQRCKIDVCRGPKEATSVGNIAVQMLTAGEVSSLTEVRKIIEISEGL